MPTNLKKHLSILGKRIKDKVTGATGVAVSVAFDLYGCVQVTLNPGLDKDGKQREMGWYDIARMEITSSEPVMPQPDFEWTNEAISAGRKGPSEKPNNRF